MKNLIITLLLFIIGFGSISAKKDYKKDYKNPVKIDTVFHIGKYIANTLWYNTVTLNVDKYNNYYLAINMIGFKDDPRKNDIKIYLNDSTYSTYDLRFEKRIKGGSFIYYDPPSVTAHVYTFGYSITASSYYHEGNPPQKYNLIYCIYPISKEFADLIKDKGIIYIKISGWSTIK